MNRKYSREKYFEVIDMLRSYRPDMAFSSDFIVGFPGETDKDFENTLDLVKRVNYAQAYSFKYSPRPHTPAAKMENQVPEDVKDKRLQILQELLNQQQGDFNSSFVGSFRQNPGLCKVMTHFPTTAGSDVVMRRSQEIKNPAPFSAPGSHQLCLIYHPVLFSFFCLVFSFRSSVQFRRL